MCPPAIVGVVLKMSFERALDRARAPAIFRTLPYETSVYVLHVGRRIDNAMHCEKQVMSSDVICKCLPDVIRLS